MIDYENNYTIDKRFLNHGDYYAGDCRNANVARWDANNNCFVYNRTKFGQTYTETIKHPMDETNKNIDVFYPAIFLGANLPKEIDL